MGISKDIDELREAGVISEETAEDIRTFYNRQEGLSTNRLFMVFGVLGAILVGMGIILIIAHNWDDLSRLPKTIIAFIPLIGGQILCAYAGFRKRESAVWKESSAAFLFFAVASSISLISQIYHIQGDLSGFLLIWMLLCIPLIYVMNASIVSLLCIVGITWYACETSYWQYPNSTSYLYWMLMALVLPHYFGLFKSRPTSNATVFHHWLIPLSLVITLGTLADRHGHFMFLAYMSLLGLLTLLGNSDLLSRQSVARNGYRMIGTIGTIIMLLMMSFDWFWEDLLGTSFVLEEFVFAPELWMALMLTAISTVLFLKRFKESSSVSSDYLSWTFALFVILFIIGLFTKLPVVLVNAALFALGIAKIREGNLRDHLGILNFGLLIIISLIICRFLDTDLSFVMRGILFIVVGVGCFLANYQMLKRRKAHV